MTPSTLWTGSTEKQPGDQPLPGYRLVAPLGRGGFGEVWKCEAPGGLQKAIKFVTVEGDGCRQEIAAFEQIKSIRHPFLLALDRVELTSQELIMVMELADCQLHDRFSECQAEGLPGIPRDELVGYLLEVAEALDMIATRYGLQHLDVKPENLFLVSGHAKVGDYGLVRRAEKVGGESESRGFTPRYSAPEVLRGRVDMRSDQYSLALVLIELLTGWFPYPGQSARELMIQHISATPDLSGLNYADRLAVGRALAKDPADRFPSCAEFVRAMKSVGDERPTGGAKSGPVLIGDSHNRPGSTSPATASAPTPPPNWNGLSPIPHRGAPEGAADAPRPPEPTTPIRRSNRPRVEQPKLSRRQQAKHPEQKPAGKLQAVVAASLLRGSPAVAIPPSSLSPVDFINAVVEAAYEVASRSPASETLAEGVASCRLLSSIPAAMIPLKLSSMAERWPLVVELPDSARVVLFCECKFEPKTKSEAKNPPPRPRTGFEVVVRRTAPGSAEYTVHAAMCGVPDDEFARQARDEIPGILDEARAVLQTFDERRAYPRFAIEFPIRAYPLFSDGFVGEAIVGHCQDVSAGGVRFATPVPVRTDRVFLEFEGVEAVEGQAILTRVCRTAMEDGGRTVLTAVRYRTRG